MRHSLPNAPQFYVTAPQPCPYLHGRAERKLFTALAGDGARELNNTLSRQGFRRSQNVVYRPSCETCVACMSARIRVADFQPSRGQRRISRRNADLVRLATSAWATEEQYDLFRRYLDARHADGGMADMDIFEFAAMIEETPVRTRVFEYRTPVASGPASAGSVVRSRNLAAAVVATNPSSETAMIAMTKRASPVWAVRTASAPRRTSSRVSAATTRSAVVGPRTSRNSTSAAARLRPTRLTP